MSVVGGGADQVANAPPVYETMSQESNKVHPQPLNPGVSQQPYVGASYMAAPPSTVVNPPPYVYAVNQQQLHANQLGVNNGQGVPHVVVVTQAPVVYQQPMITQSFVGHMVMACFVFWCCGCLFGLIAFILAVVASNSSSSGKPVEARKLGRASIGVSIAGMVLGAIAVAIILGIVLTHRSDYSYYHCSWYVNGVCRRGYY